MARYKPYRNKWEEGEERRRRRKAFELRFEIGGLEFVWVIVNTNPLRYAGKCLLHTLVDSVEGGESVGDAHKSKGKAKVFSIECIPKDMLIEAIGFAYEPFHAIAVNGMAKSFLGHRDQDRSQWFSRNVFPTLLLHLHINNSQGKCRH